MTRYLEIGGNIASSFAGRMLVGAGAEVIRLEIASDAWRLAQPTKPVGGHFFLRAMDTWLNSGKKSIAFRNYDAAAKHLPTILDKIDVVLDDASLEQRRALHLEETHEVRLPWISMTPIGRKLLELGGSSLTVSAYSAAAWAIGKPGAEPLALPHFLPMLHAGLTGATLALCAAITMEPVQIDIAAAEVLACYIDVNATQFTWERDGHRAAKSGGMYPYTILPCRDGFVCIVGRSKADWRRILTALGSPSWGKEPWAADVAQIAAIHADEADRRLSALLARYTKDDLLKLAADFGCAMAPVRSIADLAQNAELHHAGVLREALVDEVLITLPVPKRYDAAPPRVGQDGLAFLEEFGLRDHAIASDIWRDYE